VTLDTVLPSIEEPKLQPPSTAGMTTKVVKGSMWTLAGQVAPLFATLVATPFVDGYCYSHLRYFTGNLELTL